MSAEAALSTDDRLAERLRGFGPIGILVMLIVFITNNPFLPLGALIVLWWARRTGTPYSAIGLVRPRSWAMTVPAGILFGIGFKLLMKTVVMPLLGAPPINAAWHDLAGNTAALPRAAWTMIASAGFGEEMTFRGYLFERMGRLLGTSGRARAATVVITAVLFGLAHWAGQGWSAVEQATIVGLVFGTVFAATGSLYLLMIAHAAFDLTALAIIYLDLEPTVAHLFFS